MKASQYATRQEVEEIVNKAVDKAVTDLTEVIRDYCERIDERFIITEQRLDTHDQEFADNEVHHSLLYKKNIRFTAWGRKVSAKVDVPL